MANERPILKSKLKVKTFGLEEEALQETLRHLFSNLSLKSKLETKGSPGESDENNF